MVPFPCPKVFILHLFNQRGTESSSELTEPRVSPGDELLSQGHKQVSNLVVSCGERRQIIPGPSVNEIEGLQSKWQIV